MPVPAGPGWRDGTIRPHADVAELVDAHGSGPCARKGVEVQVLSSASSISSFACAEEEIPRRFAAPYSLRMADEPSPVTPPYRIETSRLVIRCWEPRDALLLKD